MGMPGPVEIVIVLLIGLSCLAPVAILVYVVLLIARKSGGTASDAPSCPNCGSHVVAGGRFCHQCGSPLEPPQGP